MKTWGRVNITSRRGKLFEGGHKYVGVGELAGTAGVAFQEGYKKVPHWKLLVF